MTPMKLESRELQMVEGHMPTGETYALSRVTCGPRRWRVSDYGQLVVVTDAYDPRQRPMRRSGLRDRIVAAARAGVV